MKKFLPLFLIGIFILLAIVGAFLYFGRLRPSIKETGSTLSLSAPNEYSNIPITVISEVNDVSIDIASEDVLRKWLAEVGFFEENGVGMREEQRNVTVGDLEIRLIENTPEVSVYQMYNVRDDPDMVLGVNVDGQGSAKIEVYLAPELLSGESSKKISSLFDLGVLRAAYILSTARQKKQLGGKDIAPVITEFEESGERMFSLKIQ